MAGQAGEVIRSVLLSRIYRCALPELLAMCSAEPAEGRWNERCKVLLLAAITP